MNILCGFQTKQDNSHPRSKFTMFDDYPIVRFSDRLTKTLVKNY